MQRSYQQSQTTTTTHQSINREPAKVVDTVAIDYGEPQVILNQQTEIQISMP